MSLLRGNKDLLRYEKVKNILTNTGYGKSSCRIFGKLGTDYTLLLASDTVITPKSE